MLMASYANGSANQIDEPVREPKALLTVTRPVIRRLRYDDARAYRAVLIEALILHSDSFREDHRVQVGRQFADVAEELERSGIFGGWVGTKLVGIGGFSKNTETKCQHRGNVSRVYVKQEFRAIGIAAMLLQEIVQFAANHVDQLEAEVTTTSEHVVYMFEKYGFQMCGLSPRGLRVNNEEFDVWTLVRILR
jgi:GNAT superfamily N-acetyltransferase